jgi:hypothetical protein
MAKIIINAKTHREACLFAANPEDAVAYDGSIADFYTRLAVVATAEGFGFEVDHTGMGPSTYHVVDETGQDDWHSAHGFMQNDRRADFWSQY